jgi:hypothetical protein
MRSFLLAILCLGAVACSAPTVNVQNNNGAANQEKSTANMVKSYATSTPPAGARSMGPQTNPSAGNSTIPITNVEVYVFSANVDDDSTDETLYWAYDEDVVYVWGTIDIDCVDEDDVETGETGVADFIYEEDAYGYGWMVGTDSCGYSTLYGCSDDGAGEVCGGCDWDDYFIVCVEE